MSIIALPVLDNTIQHRADEIYFTLASFRYFVCVKYGVLATHNVASQCLPALLPTSFSLSVLSKLISGLLNYVYSDSY